VGSKSAQSTAGAALPAPGAFDGHTHLDIMERPVPGVLEAAAAMGINRVITVGTDLGSSRWSVECASLHDRVFAAVAIHPNDVSGLDMATVAGEIEKLASSPRVVAVGETGLDYYRDYAPPALQQEWFRAHIEIAKATGKVLMIHDRDAHADVLRILSESGPPERVVFHCFSGDAEMAKVCAEAGYVMSFAGNVTFPSAGALREAAAAAPPELILAETDAPFLTPVPHRGKPNSPAMTAYTVRCLAEVKGMPVEALCEQITSTGARLYGW
jgi:TatD DNase family protein